jgi:hypothetical protein
VVTERGLLSRYIESVERDVAVRKNALEINALTVSNCKCHPPLKG